MGNLKSVVLVTDNVDFNLLCLFIKLVANAAGISFETIKLSIFFCSILLVVLLSVAIWQEADCK